MKKAIRIILVLTLIFLLGGMGGIFFERFALPRLVALSGFQKFGFSDALTERTTIINRTEQIVVEEDSSVEGVIAQPQTTVVTLLYPEQLVGRTLLPGEMISGVLMTNDGVLATYMPAAKNRPLPEAIFSDGSRHNLTLLAADEFTNLAFYKTQAGVNTASIEAANSNDIHAGKKVIALKNTNKPASADIFLSLIASVDYTFSLTGQSRGSSEVWEGTFSVSGLDGEKFQGAPVIGLTGEMVGIVGKVSEGDVTRSFLLPSNTVTQSLEKTVNGSLEEIPVFGVRYRTLTPVAPSTSGATTGALVEGAGSQVPAVTPGSPAARAGLRAGDIITKIDDTLVTLDQPLPSILYARAQGQTLSVTFSRGGEERVIQVQL